jgi:hypothetical protein
MTYIIHAVGKLTKQKKTFVVILTTSYINGVQSYV